VTGIDPARMGADVDDPRVVGWGRLPQRGERDPRDDIERVRLDGEWDFRWWPRRRDARVDAAALAEPSFGWSRLSVPAVWELNGYGTPYYLAFRYPPAMGTHGRRLGRIDPDDSPTGVYRRTIDVPAEWHGRRITLRLEGVKSAFHVLVDGELIGYSEGSMTGATFDLTDRARGGASLTVVVIVHRYSSGAFLEDQDMWFLSGITRPVWLEAEPAHSPWDVAVATDIDPVTGRGSLRVDVEGGRGSVRVLLDGALVGEGVIRDGAGRVEASDLDVLPWSAEHPNLHDLVIETTDTAGADAAADRRHVRVGFRHVEIVGHELRVNGRAIVLHGVNRHDFDPQRIWDAPSDVRRRDVALMKRANVNALRLSHYPNPDEVYRLADEYGLYVMDEAEVETHGVRRRGIPGDDPAWEPGVLARVEAMVRRSRSHPSVIMWSLGNEAGDGAVFHAAARRVRELDPGRPIHYEGDTTLETSDVFSMMYPTPQVERAIGEGQDLRIRPIDRVLNALASDSKPFRAAQYAGKPVIACEYAHQMENSFGNVRAHVENFHRYPSWAGGFVWDWVDQTIEVPLPGGGSRRAYGGAFGERPTDRWFCANGLVASDRTPHPAYAELAKVYQHVVIERTPGGVRLVNRHAFDDLSEWMLRWRVDVDGAERAAGGVDDITVSPGAARDVVLAVPELPESDPAGGELRVLTVELHRRNATVWANAGHIAAREQFVLAHTPAPAPARVRVRRTVRGPITRLHRGSTEVAIDRRSGAIVSLRVGSAELLATPLALTLWRVPTDNDRGFSNFVPALEPATDVRRWQRAQRRARPRVTADSPDGLALEWHVRGARITLAIGHAGRGIHLSLSATAGREPLVRVGLVGTLRDDLDTVTWLGRGPGESYRDRRDGSALGRWRSTPAEMAHAYARPQENGNRTDLECIALTGPAGGVRFTRVGGAPFEASVRPYSLEELDAAAYADELPTSGPPTLSLDIAHRGVGGDKPGELCLQPEGLLAAGSTWRCDWIIEPESA
jgi:beta-galactosidase/beta-glucuronidase